MNTIWYPEVALATLVCTPTKSINMIMIWPHPAPSKPVENPPKIPPRATRTKFLEIERST